MKVLTEEQHARLKAHYRLHPEDHAGAARAAEVVITTAMRAWHPGTKRYPALKAVLASEHEAVRAALDRDQAARTKALEEMRAARALTHQETARIIAEAEARLQAVDAEVAAKRAEAASQEADILARGRALLQAQQSAVEELVKRGTLTRAMQHADGLINEGGPKLTLNAVREFLETVNKMVLNISAASRQLMDGERERRAAPLLPESDGIEAAEVLSLDEEIERTRRHLELLELGRGVGRKMLTEGGEKGGEEGEHAAGVEANVEVEAAETGDACSEAVTAGTGQDEQ